VGFRAQPRICQEATVFYDLLFNGYRLDHRRASKFDASHANYKHVIAPGYYRLSAPATAFLASAFTGKNVPQTNRLGTEYELRSTPSTNMTPVRYHLFDGSSKARTGIQVDSTFFHAARSAAGGKGLDGLVLCVQFAAPWMLTALSQVGTKEAPGKAADPQIMGYFNAARFQTTDDSGKQNAWCASFVSWVMKQHGYASPANAFRALQWETFGKKLEKPVYGAIGIKSREGGGHVSFVVGRSADSNFLFMLGGNQDDKVQITRYKRSVWSTFVAPDKFDGTTESLPLYTQPADAAASEA
jgi:uncharacterized protein (TIGR02594 family)